MNLETLLQIAKPYGVQGISLGGCVELNYKGTKTAMRRSAHAHCFRKCSCLWCKGEIIPSDSEAYEKHLNKIGINYGWICVKSSKIEKLITPSGNPSQLFWHEVSHIYRPSRSQKQCDDWAWQMVRNYGKPEKPIVDKKEVEIAKLEKLVKKYQTKVKRDTTMLNKYEKKLRRLIK